MSHWKNFTSQVLNATKRSLLVKALEEMGLGLSESTKSIKNSWGQESVDAALTKDTKILSLGFKFTEGHNGEAIQVLGDFYNTGVQESTFMDRLAQVYQKHNVIEKVEEQGWMVDEVTTDADGSIRIMASQLA